jgi:hypothetical protein
MMIAGQVGRTAFQQLAVTIKLTFGCYQTKTVRDIGFEWDPNRPPRPDDLIIGSRLLLRELFFRNLVDVTNPIDSMDDKITNAELHLILPGQTRPYIVISKHCLSSEKAYRLRT